MQAAYGVATTGGVALVAQALPIDLSSLERLGVAGGTIGLLVFFVLKEREERIAANKRTEELEASIRRDLLTINQRTGEALTRLEKSIEELAKNVRS